MYSTFTHLISTGPGHVPHALHRLRQVPATEHDRRLAHHAQHDQVGDASHVRVGDAQHD